MKQECVCKPKEEVETINLSKLCPFMYPCGKTPCQDGKECPGRQDLKRHIPLPQFPPPQYEQPIWYVIGSKTSDIRWE
jgi:hypothetical protein